MATLKIHQEYEKENSIQPVNKKGFIPIKDKRFAVLTNVANQANTGPVISGKTTSKVLRDIKIKGDENTGPATSTHAAKILKKSNVGGAIEPFKSFAVYEDFADVSKTCNDVDTPMAANIKDGAIRDPLQSISLETPMSFVSGSDISPMSIDRSKILDDSTQENLKQVDSFRNDRERFYEVIEYQHAILNYFRESEKKHRPKPNYMKRQPDINDSMRTILIDWLVEVSEEYKLDTETLYLAVSYIDRFLSFMSVIRAKLQLVGTAAMYIASKYEEIYPPDVGEFVFITDDTYSKSQVLRMEQIILKILSFDLCVPTTYVYINTYGVLYQMSDEVKYLSLFISELSLLEADPYLQYYPSQISSACIAVARFTLGLSIWCTELEEVTSYSITDLKEIFMHLSVSHNASSTRAQQAIQEKYKSTKYCSVGKITPVDITPEHLEKLVEEYTKPVSSTCEISATNNENVRKMISSLMFV